MSTKNEQKEKIIQLILKNIIKQESIESLVKQVIEMSKKKSTKVRDEVPLNNKDFLQIIFNNSGPELIIKSLLNLNDDINGENKIFLSKKRNISDKSQNESNNKKIKKKKILSKKNKKNDKVKKK